MLLIIKYEHTFGDSFFGEGIMSDKCFGSLCSVGA
jgi:hypothetical protein